MQALGELSESNNVTLVWITCNEDVNRLATGRG